MKVVFSSARLALQNFIKYYIRWYFYFCLKKIVSPAKIIQTTYCSIFLIRVSLADFSHKTNYQHSLFIISCEVKFLKPENLFT
jgi:hypothetical protein